MNKNNPQINKIMPRVAKATIIIPLVIIGIALIMKLFSSQQNFFQQSVPITPTLPVPTINQTAAHQTVKSPNQTENSVAINLQGPFQCNYQDSTYTAQAFIKNKQIYVELLQNKVATKILVKGDCYYQWNSTNYVGTKTCGISPILSTLDSVLSLNLLSVDNLMSSFSQYVPSSPISPPPVSSLMKSCQKKTISDNFFVLPNNIQFKEAQPQSSKP